MNSIQIMVLSCKDNLKKYFLPVYVVWAIIIPTALILLNAYRMTDDGESLFDNILWPRVPAMYALFGLIFPLTIVTFKAFYLSFTTEVNPSFETINDVFNSLNDVELGPDAKKSLFLISMVTILWVGPLVHLVGAFIYHRKYIIQRENKDISWTDYFFGFI